MGVISKMAVQGNASSRREFVTQFKSPGHVHLLLEANGSLARRHGHTEFSLHLSRLAGLTPSTAICEMLDGKTHRALSLADAELYAKEHSLEIIDGEELFTHAATGEISSTLASVA